MSQGCPLRCPAPPFAEEGPTQHLACAPRAILCPRLQGCAPQQEREGPSLPEARLEAASPLEERAGGANFPEGSDTALKGCLRRMGDSGRAGAWG